MKSFCKINLMGTASRFFQSGYSVQQDYRNRLTPGPAFQKKKTKNLSILTKSAKQYPLTPFRMTTHVNKTS